MKRPIAHVASHSAGDVYSMAHTQVARCTTPFKDEPLEVGETHPAKHGWSPGPHRRQVYAASLISLCRATVCHDTKMRSNSPTRPYSSSDSSEIHSSATKISTVSIVPVATIST